MYLDRYLFLVIALWVMHTMAVFAQSEGISGQNAVVPTNTNQRYSNGRRDAINNNISYNEHIYFISNYSDISSPIPEHLSINDLLSRSVEGFYFNIRRDSVSNSLLLRNPDGKYSPFVDALRSIKRALDNDSTKVMTLFLDFYVDTELASVFNDAGLKDYLLEYDTKNGWPTLKRMIETGRRLVVFETQKHLNGPDWLHNLKDFVISQPGPSLGSLNYELESFDSKLRKDLFLFSGYKTLNQPNLKEEDLVTLVRRTPYFIESFKRAWLAEGKVPNFIIIDRYYTWMELLLINIRQFHIVQGAITHNNELVNYVNWEGMFNYTGGKFSFPLESGRELVLSPSSPGYEILPKTISVVSTSRKVNVSDFKARPLKIDQNLEVYLPLDNNSKDLSSRRNNGISKNIEYVHDPIRGLVASFDEESRIGLPTADVVHLKDHDFTVAAWVKIPRYLAGKEDYCILGTKNNAYQQGLHFLIRDQKPYMGFFNNDLAGNTVIEPGKWYYITWRYNKANGEQAIFVDGKLDAISFGRPPYLGGDSIFVGIADFNLNSNYTGVLDNLCIWSRVLSDKEILGISNQLIDINARFNVRSMILSLSFPLQLLVIFLSVIIIGILIYLYIFRRKTKPTIPVSAERKVVAYEDKAAVSNYIQIFGEFNVLDSHGNDITSLFTPRLKQLFLIIMLYSQRDKSGISSGELTKQVWGEDSGKSTKSLRSVSILKLRKILEKLDNTEIVFSANKYSIVFSGKVYCDYLVCMDLLKNKIRTKEEFEKFYEIISKGEVFKAESFEWLDDFKNYICNRIVDVVSKFIGQYSLERDTDMIIHLADQILLNDPSNEDALVYKVKALIHQNNGKSAKYAYDKFRTVYLEMYGEEYPKSFEQVSSAPVKENQ